jgi:hypothetical protein
MKNTMLLSIRMEYKIIASSTPKDVEHDGKHHNGSNHLEVGVLCIFIDE